MTTRGGADSCVLTLRIGSGSIRGIARVTAYTSATVVSAEVLSDMGGTTASDTWQEGAWSDKSGWPTAVRIHEGRLWWAGRNGVWGSISDAYSSFDETLEGDAGPISRTIGSGPVDDIQWLVSAKGLLLGAEGAEYVARASSLDEPLTPTNFNLKRTSSRGSGSVEPGTDDYRAVSPQFAFDAPTPWVFGDTGGAGTAVGDGYYVMLGPLSVGVHTITIRATLHFPAGELGPDPVDLLQTDLTWQHHSGSGRPLCGLGVMGEQPR